MRASPFPFLVICFNALKSKKTDSAGPGTRTGFLLYRLIAYGADLYYCLNAPSGTPAGCPPPAI